MALISGSPYYPGLLYGDTAKYKFLVFRF